MKLYKASGTCNKCGQYDKAVGSDREEAVLLLKHYHRGHAFRGEITFRIIEDKPKEKTNV